MAHEQSSSLGEFTDADAGAVIVRSVRTVAILTIAGLPIAAWKGSWRSALLLLVGAAVS